MLVCKWWAWLITGSSVIFSDAAESVVHIIAVWFAWYALRVSQQPPDSHHHYGHGKIGLISAAVEGALICIAAIVIIVSAVEKMISGIEVQQLDVGIAITAGAGTVNAFLGLYLIKVGKRSKSITVEANGRHVLTDAWTSAGAVVGLFLAWLTNVLILDPLLAIVFAANILREGTKLVSTSFGGLMDRSDPELETAVHSALTSFVQKHGLSFHQVRIRSTGSEASVDFHLQFPDTTSIKDAHQLATEAEDSVRQAIALPTVDVISHLEPLTHPSGHP